jgi:hypothetical protein
VGLVALISVLFIRERPLRRTVDIQQVETAPGAGAGRQSESLPGPTDAKLESPTASLASVNS